MQDVRWSEDLVIGDRVIDQYNRNLFELMTKSHLEVVGNSSRSFKVHNVLDDLVNYVFYHLASEEIWMAKKKFPGLIRHKEEHLRCTREVVEIHRQFEAGNITALEMISCIFNMFRTHILKYDAASRPVMDAAATKLRPVLRNAC